MLMKTYRDHNGVKQASDKAHGLASVIVNRIGLDAWSFSVVGHGAHGVMGKAAMIDMIHPEYHSSLLALNITY